MQNAYLARFYAMRKVDLIAFFVEEDARRFIRAFIVVLECLTIWMMVSVAPFFIIMVIKRFVQPRRLLSWLNAT